MYPKSGNKNPNWKGGLPNCLDCGKTITRYTKYGRCKPCSSKTEEYKKISSKAHVGQKAWNKGVRGFLGGEKHYKWNKGTSLNYPALHAWVSRRSGKASKCIVCASLVNVHWANKSHEYKRDLEDWIQLCVKCHKEYDKGRNDTKQFYVGKQRIV